MPRFLVIASALLIGPVAGCARGPELVAVTGTVQFDGRPAPGTGVTFWPTDSSPPDAAGCGGTVFTDDTGAFVLGDGAASGLRPGAYKVTFTRVVDRAGRPAPLAKPSEVGGRESVPAEYLDRDRTPVTVTLARPATALELSVPQAK
ncbi:Uncharacterized protein OS=Blastopirellula marina DSM 3645 GN=DSM3645_25799 PE=4 SV=1 [Gemmataceae bacterium]|nr:Uncharacterized protein OS=Blastopirellula marina DSM 3645 GN=DSM3645_25799 PE=4 SV=1 [Gemmataceae bacterium]VTU02568.1 Uncharacterized protein OS=Blastopirellula marina DSM 3645 GN=DSM3645_25799 PE=4 SV=1 [Gemmataceae bacterium]